MADAEASTPRVFFARHGETTWAKTGQFTGSTDIELTSTGEAQIAATASTLAGQGKLLDPTRLTHVFVSPLKRARKTFDLLFPEPLPADKVTVTPDIAEWNYGDYEGLLGHEIRALRKKRGLDKEREWDIWRDGCEGGESVEEITTRLDRLIAKIKEIQAPHMQGDEPADILLVAHGLILRCFVKRWLGLGVDFPLQTMLAPGAIGVVSYKYKDVNKPAFCVGMALPFAEKSEEAEEKKN